MDIENKFVEFHTHHQLMSNPSRSHYIGSPSYADHSCRARRSKNMGERGNIVVKVTKILQQIGSLRRKRGSATINADHLVRTGDCQLCWNA